MKNLNRKEQLNLMVLRNMKKSNTIISLGKVIIIISTLALLSCQPYINEKWDELPGLIGEWDNIKSLPDIESWINAHIKYKDESKDFWQYSSETLLWGHGDCEDKAILFCAMANKLFNKKPMLALYYYNYYKYHAEAVYNKTEYFSLAGECYLIWLWNYNEIANEIEKHRF